MDAHCQMIYDEYLEKQPMFSKIKELALEIINRMLAENNLYVVTVESRKKTPDSLKGKLERKGYKYKTLDDITDIVGTRIVTFYQDEVDKIAGLVEKHFTIDWENSVDKRKLYADENADRFGYMSLHYIISIPKDYYYDENCPELNDVKFEIQIRTALQHVWATSAHDTGYKSDIEIPKRYIRSLSRLAGLMELADEEFSKLIKDIAEYRRKVQSLISIGQFDELLLDGDTFKSYMAIGPFDELNRKIASINRAEISNVNTENYLKVLKFLGMKTIADIEQLKRDYSDMAYQIAVRQLSDTDLDIVASNIGIKNICIACICDREMGIPGLRHFYNIINGKKPTNERTAERTLKTVESVALI